MIKNAMESSSYESELTRPALKLVGGALCLDFVNSVDWRRSAKRREWIASYVDLLAWCVHAECLDQELADFLLRRARSTPAQADAMWQNAVAFRETLYELFHSLTNNEIPSSTVLETATEQLVRYLARSRLSYRMRLTIECAGEKEMLEHPLWQVAWSMVDLVRTEDLSRLKECAYEECRWVFLDKSRSRSRRWCDMANCGNLAKAHRFRNRHRQE